MNRKNEQQTPLGIDQNLPTEIRDIAGLRNRVLAWTTIDPSYNIDKYVSARIFGFFVCPLFWPHLLLMWPCLLATKSKAVNMAKSQYWILDERELKIVTTNHEESCIPGLCTSGNVVKSIPLSNITDCGFDESGKGFFNSMSGDMPTIYIDTASSGVKGGHEAFGLGLNNSKAFIDAILHQRDLVTGGPGNVNVSTTPVQEAVVVLGQSQNNTAERLGQVKDLFDSGVLTASEYEKKRQEIIASI